MKSYIISLIITSIGGLICLKINNNGIYYGINCFAIGYITSFITYIAIQTIKGFENGRKKYL